ncbi:MAG: Fe-S protein assembly co-chaperone HscB [Burkholderiaceae bacterium]|jgi:molecular chaperone HscB|nr:Fe-S protein assembly co-chaperone HscB [Burkholderiaceae bacterium]
MQFPNHFALFGLPEQFTLDKAVLEEAYHEIQRVVHPDRFGMAGDAALRSSVQWASRANDAYHVLRDPLKRAIYLCEIKGVPLDTDAVSAVPPDFVLEQITWREELDVARVEKDTEALSTLSARLWERKRALLQLIGEQLDRKDFLSAVQAIRKMMFLDRFSDEINRIFDEMEATS